jgi:hypothetical protein
MKCAINLIGFQRFDEGTLYTISGKPESITLPDPIYSSTPQALEVHR